MKWSSSTPTWMRTDFMDMITAGEHSDWKNLVHFLLGPYLGHNQIKKYADNINAKLKMFLFFSLLVLKINRHVNITADHSTLCSTSEYFLFISFYLFIYFSHPFICTSNINQCCWLFMNERSFIFSCLQGGCNLSLWFIVNLLQFYEQLIKKQLEPIFLTITMWKQFDSVKGVTYSGEPAQSYDPNLKLCPPLWSFLEFQHIV